MGFQTVIKPKSSLQEITFQVTRLSPSLSHAASRLHLARRPHTEPSSHIRSSDVFLSCFIPIIDLSGVIPTHIMTEARHSCSASENLICWCLASPWISPTEHSWSKSNSFSLGDRCNSLPKPIFYSIRAFIYVSRSASKQPMRIMDISCVNLRFCFWVSMWMLGEWPLVITCCRSPAITTFSEVSREDLMVSQKLLLTLLWETQVLNHFWVGFVVGGGSSGQGTREVHRIIRWLGLEGTF